MHSDEKRSDLPRQALDTHIRMRKHDQSFGFLPQGFETFAALPHVSGANPRVSAERPTPQGLIAVEAERDNSGVVTVKVSAPVSGVVGLRLEDERTGCTLDRSTIKLTRATNAADNTEGEGTVLGLGLGLEVAVGGEEGLAIDSLHPNVVSAHAFVRVAQPGRHVITAAFHEECAHSLALADAHDHQQAAIVAEEEAAAAPGNKSLPSVPPFAPAVYPASWTELDR
jgi:hypothetical protein